MNGAASLEVVVADLLLVSELSATEDESDLRDLNAFLLLEGLLYLEDRVVGLEVVGLLLACQGLSVRIIQGTMRGLPLSKAAYFIII